MSRRFPPVALVCALLAVCAGVAGLAAADTTATVGAPAPAEVVTVANTTNYLFPSEEPSRQEFVRANVDVGSAVAVGAERLRGRHDRLTFDARFDGQNTSGSQRLAVVRETVDHTENRLDRLDRTHERLLESYANGSLGAEAFVGRLAQLEAQAARSRALLSHAQSRVETSFDTSLPGRLETRLSGLQAELVALPGPMDDALSGAVTGSTDPVVAYTESTSSGIVLASVEDGTFVRQATVRSEYAPDEPNQFVGQPRQPIALAFQRAAELYPWVFENTLGNQRISGFGDSGVYLVDASHPHGELRSYIHGGSADVFREEHRQQPAAVPVRLAASNETDQLNVGIDAATETGPMRVIVTDNAGIPVNAAVSVDGTAVGSTGADGQLWTVRPSGSFQVNATAGSGETVVLRHP